MKSYYHPERGYFAFMKEPLDSIKASWPEGTIETTGRPSEYHFWVDGAWVERQPVAQLAEEARDKRNALLTASDYTQLADSPRDKQSWAVYRQALRDITGQVGFPETIVWPVAP